MIKVPSYTSTYSNRLLNPLEEINYRIFFSYEKSDMLNKYITFINKDTMEFKCVFEGNRIQPYELLMDLICNKTKMDVTIDIGDFLSLKYKKIEFIEIENNFKFHSNTCDFSRLFVKIKYDKVIYINNKLNIREKRKAKLIKINNNKHENK